MTDVMSMYRAHLWSRQAADAYLVAYYAEGYTREFQISQALKHLDALAEELGFTITWPDAPEAEDANDAAAALSRKLEAEDAARDYMTAAQKETEHA